MQSHEPGASPESGKPASTIRESLSALMDGESEPLELQRLLKQASDDDDLRATWARFQVTSALIRKQSVDSAVVSLAMADRIQQALQQESEPADAESRPAWARFAVAASVALLVVAGVQWRHLSGIAEQPVVAHNNASVGGESLSGKQELAVTRQDAAGKTTSQVFLASEPAGRNAQSQQVQFEYYMQYHLEKASLNNGRGMVPLSRKVSAEER